MTTTHCSSDARQWREPRDLFKALKVFGAPDGERIKARRSITGTGFFEGVAATFSDASPQIDCVSFAAPAWRSNSQ
jgi:hypothetical protein